mgnify:CR=1 FL=1
MGLRVNAVDGECHIHDWHATILHLLGLNHAELTYRYAGRDLRLTDVYGNVIQVSLLKGNRFGIELSVDSLEECIDV